MTLTARLYKAHRSAPARDRARSALLCLAVASGALGCRDLARFDTGRDGAYCGKIIDGDFTRSGFAPGLGLRLTLDIDALDTAPGTLSTDDAASGPCTPRAEFEAAPLVVTPQLLADPLSQLDFGATRDHNFVAWVDSTCQGSALGVVSLMHTGQVEVRLLRRGPPALTGDFGVFQLTRTDCEF